VRSLDARSGTPRSTERHLYRGPKAGAQHGLRAGGRSFFNIFSQIAPIFLLLRYKLKVHDNLFPIASQQAELFPKKNVLALDRIRIKVIKQGMEQITIPRIVRERLAALGLSQLPPAAVTHLVAKLAAQVRTQAARSITPRAVARAVLASAPVAKSSSQPVPEVVAKS